MASANESGEKSGSAAARAVQLLDRGLELYGAGDLLSALAAWDEALALDPTLARAREYVDYVRANFDELAAQFASAREAEEAASAQGVPLGQDGGGGDDGDYEVELDAVSSHGLEELDAGLAQLEAGLEKLLEQAEEPEPPALEIEAMAPDEDLPGIAPFLENEPGDEEEIEPAADDEATIDVRVLPALRRGYDLDSVDDFDDLPPAGTRPHVMTIQPRPADIPSGAGDLEMPGIELEGIDDKTDARSTLRSALPPVRVQTSPPVGARRTGPGLAEDDEATHAYDRRGGIVVTPHRQRTGFLEDLATRDRLSPIGRDDFVESEFTGEYEDMRKTREHNPFAGGMPTTEEPPVEGTDSSVIVDERLMDSAGLATDAARDPDRTSDFRPRRDPGKEAREEALRRRVTELLRSAEEAAGKGEFLAAVASVEQVMQEDEEGVIAPVMLHRHRDLLYRIYEGHIGDMHAVPLVAVPLHEIAGQALDHRTGFLLSRIDGMLSFEDILDVAGMPRMEAYQILSNLLRKGVIEVR